MGLKPAGGTGANEMQQKQLMANFEDRVIISRWGTCTPAPVLKSAFTVWQRGEKPGQRIGLFSYGSGAEGVLHGTIMINLRQASG